MKTTRFYLFNPTNGLFLRARIGGVYHWTDCPDQNDGWNTENEANAARVAGFQHLSVKPYIFA